MDTLRLDRIQGNIHPGFGASHQAFLWLAFGPPTAAREWLAEILPEISSGTRVAMAKETRQRAGYDADAPGGPSSTWVNVAFSPAGLVALGAPDVAQFSEAFRSGLAARADALGDPDPKGWVVGGPANGDAHALLIVATDSAPRLDAEVERLRKRLATHQVRDLLADGKSVDC